MDVFAVTRKNNTILTFDYALFEGTYAWSIDNVEPSGTKRCEKNDNGKFTFNDVHNRAAQFIK